MPTHTRSHDERKEKIDIFFAVAGGSLEEVNALLAARVDPNACDYEQRTPLHIAAGFGSLDIMKVLIDHKADVNALDYWGQSPLSQSKRGSHHSAGRMLKDNGATRQKSEVQKQAVWGHWELQRSDIQFGGELNRTLKSIVFRATWSGVDVVVKQSLPGAGEAAAAEEVDAELLHEVEILAGIRHPDLVGFLGCCLQEPPLMFVTEYMAGGDLERHYERKRKAAGGSPWVPPHRVVSSWAHSVLRALNFMHHCSPPIIHRDLKPLNILLTLDLQAKVTDFGISRSIHHLHDAGLEDDAVKKGASSPSIRLRARAMSAKSLNSVMTRGVGTWRYMAPEVARGEAYTEKIDIFSWALILYFMSSGRQPFHEYKDLEVVLDEFSAGGEPRPKSSECPAKLRPIMESAWHAKPGSRPGATELIDSLMAASGQTGCACTLL